MINEARYIILEDTVLLSKKDYADWHEISKEYDNYKTNLDPMDCDDTIGYFEIDYKNENDWPFSRKNIIEFFQSDKMVLYADGYEFVKKLDDFNWGILKDNHFLNVLNSELTADHPLYGKARKALARCHSQDDFLFLLDDKSYAIVHLTFSKNNIGGTPYYIKFADLQSVIHEIENESLSENEE
jgi:hypothetical protein